MLNVLLYADLSYKWKRDIYFLDEEAFQFRFLENNQKRAKSIGVCVLLLFSLLW